MCKPDMEKGEVHMGKFCTNCGKELGENAKFCSRCGKPTGDNMQNTPINVEHNGGKIEKKWYQTTKGICLWLVIFFPVGIYLMWKYADWKKKWKVTVTILWIAVAIGRIITLGDDTSDVEESLIKNENCPYGATYNFSLEEAKDKTSKILSNYYNTEIDLNQIEETTQEYLNDGMCYMYTVEVPQGYSFAIQFTVYDDKVSDIMIKAGVTAMEEMTSQTEILEDVPKLFSKIVSGMTDDKLSVDDIQSAIEAGNTNYYRNGNAYGICKMQEYSALKMYNYDVSACTEEKAEEAGCLDL